jgi:chemotaxis protein methyltransferase CheR
MDAEVDSARLAVGKEFDLEMGLLVDAVYRMYHYDFRGYAPASMRRRLRTATIRFGCRSLSQLHVSGIAGLSHRAGQ